MKQIMLMAASALVGCFILTPTRAAETNSLSPAGQRIGIYDSRVVAYAHFWSDAHQQSLKERVATAHAAKAAGNMGRLNELGATLKQEQDQNHRQVFSTAPVDKILDGMKTQVLEIQKQARASRLVSKWDAKTLKELKRAEKVDVSDLLLGEFKLTDKQKKVAESFKKVKPLSPAKCEELLKKGEL